MPEAARSAVERGSPLSSRQDEHYLTEVCLVPTPEETAPHTLDTVSGPNTVLHGALISFMGGRATLAHLQTSKPAQPACYQNLRGAAGSPTHVSGLGFESPVCRA